MKVEIDPKIFLTYRARDIQTKLDSTPTCIDVAQNSYSALSRLREFSFDQAPVTSNGVVIGWVLASDLEVGKSVTDCMNRLSPDDLISSEAPLNDLLVRLIKQQLIFLVGNEGIEGFVVRSDIGRHVSRAHLYLLISGLEIIMTKIIAREFNAVEELETFMSPSSRTAWERERRQGFDANPVEYLDIKGLGQALAKLKTPLIHMGVSQSDWKTYIEILGLIRNWVAHSNTEQLVKHPFFDIIAKVQLTEKYIYKHNSF